jgi:ankyrin repeat protein
VLVVLVLCIAVFVVVVLFFSPRPLPGELPLVLAAADGDVELIQRILDNGADPNELDYAGESAFMAAAESGQYEAMLVLYEAGGDPSKLTGHGDSVLTLVANGTGDVEVAQWLLDHGVDPCIPPSDWLREIVRRDTTIEIATRYGHDDLVVLLEQAATDCPAG